MAKNLQVSGERYGHLVAVCPVGSDSEKGGMGAVWGFTCDCGGYTTKPLAIVRGYVARGLKPKCEKCSSAKSDAEKRFYWVWKALRQRCYNPKHRQYKDYGGRGIQVCERWMEFKNFKEDMWSTYSVGFQIDRVNNDGDYSPGNCRWVDSVTNCRNRRDSNRVKTPNGEFLTVTEAARRYGISEKTLRSRVNKGWPAHKLFRPARHCGVRSRNSRAL